MGETSAVVAGIAAVPASVGKVALLLLKLPLLLTLPSCVAIGAVAAGNTAVSSISPRGSAVGPFRWNLTKLQ
jgi:hypothetical protein